jgi:carboxyl-terminal processing protease
VKKIALLFFLCVLLSTSAAAQTKPAPQPVVGGAAASAPDLRQETFDIVWRTVKEKHFDPTLGGIDWDKVRERYAPRVSAVKNDGELYSLLQQMLGELHQSHFYIIPPEAIIQSESKESQDGGIGVDIRFVDNQAVITRVEPGSRGASAGLRTGFVIKKVDNLNVEQITERFLKSKESPAIIRLLMVRAVLGNIKGKPETSVRIAYLDERDHLREAIITRERLKGEMSPAFGNFPPQYTEIESKRLANGIGYIRFNIFVTMLMDKIRAAIREMNNAPGIIIDLRGNPGGLGAMANGIAGMLETKQVSLGTMKMRTTQFSFIAFPQTGAYSGPVVILIDGGSASTSEVFAAGVQELGRAIVVGERSAGAALPSHIMQLPTGARLQYAVADFKTPKGVLIEGRGVKPDVEVALTRRALLGGSDSQLEAAIEQIKKKAGEKRQAASDKQ